MPDNAQARRAIAEGMTYALGIALYLDEDGTISQFGPGERIEPPPNALPTGHGHGARPEAAATP
jgi:hypothetical protein